MRGLRPSTVISCTRDQCFQKTGTIAAACCHWGPQRKGGRLSAGLSVTPGNTKQEKDKKHWGRLSQCIAADAATGSGGWTPSSKSIANFSFYIFSIFPVTDKTVIFKEHNVPIFFSDTLSPPSAPNGVDVCRWHLWTRFILEVQKNHISREKVLSLALCLAAGSIFHHRLQWGATIKPVFLVSVVRKKWSVQVHLVGTSARHLWVLILCYFLVMWFLGF